MASAKALMKDPYFGLPDIAHIGGPFCRCPYHKSPTFCGVNMMKDPDFWTPPSRHKYLDPKSTSNDGLGLPRPVKQSLKAIQRSPKLLEKRSRAQSYLKEPKAYLKEPKIPKPFKEPEKGRKG